MLHGSNLSYQIADVTYAYRIYGEGPPLVLLHGFTGSKLTWLPFIKEWRRTYKVIIIDLPGHGETMTNNPRSIQLICQDLKQFFKDLKLSPVHLLGYSMGGRIALSFANYYPEAIKSLILESASPGLALEEEREERIKSDEQLAQRIENKGIQAFVTFWENISLFNTQKKLHPDLQQSIRHERLNQTKQGLAESLRSIGTGVQPSWWDHLHRICVPTLLIVGKKDTKFVKINKDMKQRLKRATIKVVNDVGHTVHIENRATFSKLVLNFLKKYRKK